jgi:hypothetical protein
MENSKESTGGLGIVTVVQIIFLILKLTGNIWWSWWWVLSPIWIPIALFFLVFFTMLIVINFLLLFGFKSEELLKYFDNIKSKNL